MALKVGAIAGIAVASTLIALVIIWIGYVIIKKRRRTAEYVERCGQLWQKYSSRSRQGSDVVAKFPFADPTYVKTPLSGQQFTSRELNQGSTKEFVLLRKQSGTSNEGKVGTGRDAIMNCAERKLAKFRK